MAKLRSATGFFKKILLPAMRKFAMPLFLLNSIESLDK